MKLFELLASGPTGDCTTPYNVAFHNECTVREFIDEVLKQNEWGFIEVLGDGPSIGYENDKIIYGSFGQIILNSKIIKATANGGWTRMDYVLDIDILTNEQKLRNEYTRTLQEIVRHEREIEKLKEKYRELDDQLTSIESMKGEM